MLLCRTDHRTVSFADQVSEIVFVHYMSVKCQKNDMEVSWQFRERLERITEKIRREEILKFIVKILSYIKFASPKGTWLKWSRQESFPAHYSMMIPVSSRWFRIILIALYSGMKSTFNSIGAFMRNRAFSEHRSISCLWD
jgi:hypothetical protein